MIAPLLSISTVDPLSVPVFVTVLIVPPKSKASAAPVIVPELVISVAAALVRTAFPADDVIVPEIVRVYSYFLPLLVLSKNPYNVAVIVPLLSVLDVPQVAVPQRAL